MGENLGDDDEEAEARGGPVLPPAPPDGWTLDNLPDDLPHHTELIRGELVLNRQTTWHMRAVGMLIDALDEQCPSQLTLQRAMPVRLSPHTAPEPDICVVRASSVDLDTAVFRPEDVLGRGGRHGRVRGARSRGQAQAVRGDGDTGVLAHRAW